MLLVPILLFLLGLPNKPLTASFQGSVDATAENTTLAIQDASLTAQDPWGRLVWLAKYAGDQAEGEVYPVDMKRLLDSPHDAADREYLRGKTVSVRGQYVGSPQDPRFFQLIRLQISCCGADAQPKPILVFCKEPVSMKSNGWCEVTGKVEYFPRGNTHVLRLLVNAASKVKPCNPDLNPYIQ